MLLQKVDQIPDLFHGKKEIVPLETALSQETVFIDVRTPKEFEESAIPGAINCPLFEDRERAQIGTLYKRFGQKVAIELGKSLADSRLSQFVKRFFPYKQELITVYCARGGMRSAAVVQLLASLEFRVQQLEKGYKGYRKHVLQKLETLCPTDLIVIHGKTGVGKTRLLKKLSDSLDLEDLAQHRSSLFGAINKKPRSQKSFDSYLFSEFCKLSTKSHLFIEGESRKIGNIFIPDSLFNVMRQGTMVLLTASLETRIERIIEDYVSESENTFHQLETALQSLRGALSNSQVNWLCQCLKRKEYEIVVETLLIEYYDPRYKHSMKNYHYALEVSGEDLDKAAEQLRAFQKTLRSSSPSLNV